MKDFIINNIGIISILVSGSLLFVSIFRLMPLVKKWRFKNGRELLVSNKQTGILFLLASVFFISKFFFLGTWLDLVTASLWIISAIILFISKEVIRFDNIESLQRNNKLEDLLRNRGINKLVDSVKGIFKKEEEC